MRFAHDSDRDGDVDDDNDKFIKRVNGVFFVLICTINCKKSELKLIKILPKIKIEKINKTWSEKRPMAK